LFVLRRAEKVVRSNGLQVMADQGSLSVITKGEINMFETAQPQAGTANQPEVIEILKTSVQDTYEGGSEDRQDGSSGNGSPEEKVLDESFMTVRYNKEDKPLSKEEAVVYAQKGMNYDKLSERLKELSARLNGYEKGSQTSLAADSEEAKQALIDYQLEDFIRENPGEDPGKLPESVVGEWKKGVPLKEAFLKYETQELSEKLQEMMEGAVKSEVNRKNEAASMGQASEGAARTRAINEESIKGMTSEELDRNHERIWAYLTGR
jgi:hypothetical protein